MNWKCILNFKLRVCNLKFAIMLSFGAVNELPAQTYSFPWLNDDVDRPAIQKLKPPVDYERITTTPDTFADWLRNLPLK